MSNELHELSISSSVAEKAGVAPLWSAIYREGNVGTVGKRIKATMTGKVEVEKRNLPILLLTDVRRLSLACTPDDDRPALTVSEVNSARGTISAGEIDAAKLSYETRTAQRRIFEVTNSLRTTASRKVVFAQRVAPAGPIAPAR